MDLALMRSETSRHLRRAGTVRFGLLAVFVAAAVPVANALGSQSLSRASVLDALDNVSLIAVVTAAVWGAGVIGSWFSNGVALALAVWRPRRTTTVLVELTVVAAIAALLAVGTYLTFAIGVVFWSQRSRADTDAIIDALVATAGPFVVAVGAAAVLGACLSFVFRSTAASVGIIIGLGFFGEALLATLIGLLTGTGGRSVLGWLPIQGVLQITARGTTLLSAGGPPAGVAGGVWVALLVLVALSVHQRRELR